MPRAVTGERAGREGGGDPCPARAARPAWAPPRLLFHPPTNARARPRPPPPPPVLPFNYSSTIAEGLSTGNKNESTSCDYIAAGFYYNGTEPVECPADTYFGTYRNTTDAEAGCTNCTLPLTTNNYTAQSSCGWVIAGYYFNATGAPLPCGADSYSSSPQELMSGVANNCTNCSTGLTTANATGETSCNSWVLPGYFYNNASGLAVACLENTYADSTRNTSLATATACTNW